MVNVITIDDDHITKATATIKTKIGDIFNCMSFPEIRLNRFVGLLICARGEDGKIISQTRFYGNSQVPEVYQNQMIIGKCEKALNEEGIRICASYITSEEFTKVTDARRAANVELGVSVTVCGSESTTNKKIADLLIDLLIEAATPITEKQSEALNDCGVLAPYAVTV